MSLCLHNQELLLDTQVGCAHSVGGYGEGMPGDWGWHERVGMRRLQALRGLPRRGGTVVWEGWSGKVVVRVGCGREVLLYCNFSVVTSENCSMSGACAIPERK